MKRNPILTVFWVVAISLTASATIINIPDDYDTIQQGIDASTDGDTVLVQPGTYVENINFNGNNIVVASFFLTSGNPEYIENTIIDGDSAGTVVRFTNSEDSTAAIAGFTIRNGYANYGAGIYCSGSDPSVRNNIICDNLTTYQYYMNGGGIYLSHSNSEIKENRFERNRACFGAGIYLNEATPIISNNIFRYNMADW